MCTNMPFKIYTKKQVHVSSVPRHCVLSEISTAMRDGTETRSRSLNLFLQVASTPSFYQRAPVYVTGVMIQILEIITLRTRIGAIWPSNLLNLSS